MHRPTADFPVRRLSAAGGRRLRALSASVAAVGLCLTAAPAWADRYVTGWDPFFANGESRFPGRHQGDEMALQWRVRAEVDLQNCGNRRARFLRVLGSTGEGASRCTARIEEMTVTWDLYSRGKALDSGTFKVRNQPVTGVALGQDGRLEGLKTDFLEIHPGNPQAPQDDPRRLRWALKFYAAEEAGGGTLRSLSREVKLPVGWASPSRQLKSDFVGPVLSYREPGRSDRVISNVHEPEFFPKPDDGPGFVKGFRLQALAVNPQVNPQILDPVRRSPINPEDLANKPIRLETVRPNQ